jgi:hypothetical protein
VSKALLVVGATDVGKSFYIKDLISKNLKNFECLVVYDVNNEYSHLSPYDFESDFEKFAENATHLRNSIIIFEEATIFLDGRTIADKYTKTVLALKKHRNNMIILVFHAVSEIPLYVYRLANYITIFKTNDLPDMSARELRDIRLKEFMQRVKNSPDIHYHETLKIY